MEFERADEYFIALSGRALRWERLGICIDRINWRLCCSLRGDEVWELLMGKHLRLVLMRSGLNPSHTSPRSGAQRGAQTFSWHLPVHFAQNWYKIIQKAAGVFGVELDAITVTQKMKRKVNQIKNIQCFLLRWFKLTKSSTNVFSCPSTAKINSFCKPTWAFTSQFEYTNLMLFFWRVNKQPHP